MMERLWTVVRFPNGSWSSGENRRTQTMSIARFGQIDAATAKAAVRKAQAKRSRDLKKHAAMTGV